MNSMNSAMAKPQKVDWVALIDQVWDQESNDSVPAEERPESSSLLCCTPLNKQMKLCIEKVSTSSSATLCDENPLNQTLTPPKCSIASTCVETPNHTEPNMKQMDILWYLDSVYNTYSEPHFNQTPRKALVSSPLRRVDTPLDKSLSDTSSEARKLFPTGGDDELLLERNGHATKENLRRKRKRNSLFTVEYNEKPVKRAKAIKTRKGIKKENDEQLYLDLGQKDFGHVSCPTCGMVYTKGQPEDKMEHIQFHRKFVSGVSFPGWKKERVVQLFGDGRVILVLPSDPKQHLKKIEDIFRIMDIELGYAAGTTPRGDKHKVFLYISAQKRIMGCVVAEEALEGYQVLTNSECKQESFDSLSSWLCSTTPQPAELGINRVWVAAPYRRKGVGTRLLDTVRSNFSPGKIVAKNLIAFTDPTPDGKAFAAKYCATHNFLVYRWV